MSRKPVRVRAYPGEKRDGSPCKHCGGTLRYVKKSGHFSQCVACNADAGDKRRKIMQPKINATARARAKARAERDAAIRAAFDHMNKSNFTPTMHEEGFWNGWQMLVAAMEPQ